MTNIVDAEFGEINVRTMSNASRISIKVAPNGSLRISAPKFTPKFAIASLLKSSRQEIRKMVNSQRKLYDTDRQIGKSHSLVIQTNIGMQTVSTIGTTIFATTTSQENVISADFQQEIRQEVLKALRKEAKSYLPRRLRYLADQYDFSYEKTKLTHASSRWGSCSSSGTISLNIALMSLPFELIDYVLVHELCHTKFMDHSDSFWELVGQFDPSYKLHRKLLKQHTPNI